LKAAAPFVVTKRQYIFWSDMYENQKTACSCACFRALRSILCRVCEKR